MILYVWSRDLTPQDLLTTPLLRSGKMCLLDVNPQSLKVLKTSEFVPYIVFIEAPPFETLVQMHKESARDNPNKAFSVSWISSSILSLNKKL